MVNLANAYAECERQAAEHYENFPVASILLPRSMRRHVAAVYAFARTADDLADEGSVPDEDRLRQLDLWQQQVHGSVRWLASDQAGRSNATEPTPGMNLVALAATIRDRQLPLELFDDLISAFKQDVVRKRYETWPELLDYCRRSANPVGRLVLRIAGITDETLDRASDAVCTALQLTNFWQDIEVDWRKGRIYLPRDARERHGAAEGDLAEGRWTAGWRGAVAEAAGQTARLFDAGRPVCDRTSGRLRQELRLTWLGGRRILRKLHRQDYDVFRARPKLGVADLPAMVWQTVTWRRLEDSAGAGPGAG